MSCILQIGAGGVGGVVAHKLAQNRQTFSKIVLASRDIRKCQAISQSIRDKNWGEVICESVDANNFEEVVKLIKKYQPKIVVHVALPYQNLVIMEACLATKTNYLDTANYEHPSKARFEYKEQWAYHEKFRSSGIVALLGCGFDPGVTNVFCAYAKKHYFDSIRTIDILDCNAGDHGYPFATNFNPEINLREVSAPGRYWENGRWIETKPLEIVQQWAYPGIGERDSYLLYHEELESLSKNIPGLQRIRFFMTFSQSYITHMKCLENVGMLGIEEVEYNGQKIVPIQFLKTLLPDPATLAGRTVGKTNIGCYIVGSQNSRDKSVYIYNICDHQEAYKEVNAQAVSFTTGVPAMIASKLVAEGIWGVNSGVWNLEQLDPDPFMEELNKQGLPWQVIEKSE